MAFIPAIDILVQTQYLAAESNPDNNRFVFAYSITITNNSAEAVKLLNRYWHITDNNNKVQEVHGEGVVGVQPYLANGESFHYTSGSILETSAGMMKGHYEFITDSKELFTAEIPAFSLVDPSHLH